MAKGQGVSAMQKRVSLFVVGAKLSSRLDNFTLSAELFLPKATLSPNSTECVSSLVTKFSPAPSSGTS